MQERWWAESKGAARSGEGGGGKVEASREVSNQDNTQGNRVLKPGQRLLSQMDHYLTVLQKHLGKAWACGRAITTTLGEADYSPHGLHNFIPL
jgi:hypothetical protein